MYEKIRLNGEAVALPIRLNGEPRVEVEVSGEIKCKLGADNGDVDEDADDNGGTV